MQNLKKHTLSKTAELVYGVVRQIPKGKVTTYGFLAHACGIKSPRLVGHLLHINPYAPHVPCHRVVNREGKLAVNFGAGGIAVHAKRLSEEGVEVQNNRVDLAKYLWQPKHFINLTKSEM